MKLHRPTIWCAGLKPSEKSGQGICEPVCGGTRRPSIHQQKQEGMGWKQLRMRCNRLWLFPLAFIRLSYLICNGFHLVALIPQGSNNIQLPLFSFPHDSSLILNLCKCFITDGLKKSDRDDYQDRQANNKPFLDQDEWGTGVEMWV